MVWFIVLTQTLTSKDKERYIDYFFTPSVGRADSFFWRKRQTLCPVGAFPLAREYSSDGAFVKFLISSNLLVSANALLLSFQIPRSLRFLGMTRVLAILKTQNSPPKEPLFAKNKKRANPPSNLTLTIFITEYKL